MIVRIAKKEFTNILGLEGELENDEGKDIGNICRSLCREMIGETKYDDVGNIISGGSMNGSRGAKQQ